MSCLFTEDIRDDPEAQARVRRWIEALRSGKYEQAGGWLRWPRGWCCLGVACHLFDASQWRLAGDRSIYGEGYTQYLPENVRAAYGLQSPAGAFDAQFDEYGDASEALSDLNDREIPFGEIADVIERELAEALGAAVQT